MLCSVLSVVTFLSLDTGVQNCKFIFYKQNNKKKSFNSLQLNYCNTTAAIEEHVEVASKFVTC